MQTNVGVEVDGIMTTTTDQDIINIINNKQLAILLSNVSLFTTSTKYPIIWVIEELPASTSTIVNGVLTPCPPKMKVKSPVITKITSTVSSKRTSLGKPALHDVRLQTRVLVDVSACGDAMVKATEAKAYVNKSLAGCYAASDWGRGVELLGTSKLGDFTFNLRGRSRYGAQLVLDYKYYIRK